MDRGRLGALHGRVGSAGPEAESTARELEEGLDGLTQIAFERPRIPVERTTVVVFRGESDFHAFLPSGIDGIFSHSLHDGAGLMVQARYIAAWAFVHMLVDGSADYQRRFTKFYEVAVGGKTFDEAFRAAFGDLPVEQVDRDFRRYLDARDLAVLRSRYQPPKTPFTYAVRSLTDAEVHIYWARLAPWTGKSGDAALRDLDAALAAAPSSPEPHYYRGLFWLARGNLRSAEEELARATRVSPNEPRFLLATLVLRSKQYELASGAPDEGPVREAAERLSRVAKTPNELNTAAVTLEALSQVDEALALAQRAVALAPYDSDILDTYASVLFDLGRADEAVDVQTAAVSFLDEHTDESVLRERLERYKRSVVAAPAPLESAEGDAPGR